jgi:hypothetical protein
VEILSPQDDAVNSRNKCIQWLNREVNLLETGSFASECRFLA